MPTITENKLVFDSEKFWVHYGEEWSSEWGGLFMQWYVALLPRIYKFIPAQTILEIGAGQGRFAKYLKEYTENLILVDLSETCIETCKVRFSEDTNIQYFVNDGKSLDMIADDSVDFVFSHDALVFTEEPDLNEYIRQLAQKLKKNGAAFIHHSNLGEYWYYNKLSQRSIKLLRKLKLIENDSWRAYSVSAEKVRKMCSKVGLECIVQELITWSTEKTLNDCYSVIVHRDSSWYRKPKIYRNRNFDNFKKYTKKLAKVYHPDVTHYKGPTVTYETVSDLKSNEK
jgi:ubiquinone/menaquinone biosynthesis C-methylase UbiE